MSLPFRIETFNAYKSAVAAALSTLVGPETRGIEVRLQVGARRVDVVVLVASGDPSCDVSSLTSIAVGIADRFEEFAGFSTTVVIEHAEAAGPLIYRGCPVWARAGTQWQLAPDLKARLETARVERVDSRPEERT